jgi:murein DD-endopeptidase MepM/ murein hydrolase activator NlpD
MNRCVGRLVHGLVVTALVLSLGSGNSVAAQPPREIVLYVAPVAAEVIDPFRPPAHIGAPGNRGLEYGNPPDALVRAAAPGWVTFAGQVGGTKAVTITHTDGVRTSYTGLAELYVSIHEQVGANASIGTADRHLHFGARVHDHYLDPQILIDASQATTVHSRLIPPPD